MGSWVKKKVLGKGTFGTVSYSVPRYPRDPLNVPAVAVKSADYKKSSSLQKEAHILHKLRHCPGILRCFGEDVSFEDGIKIYNMLLEFASGGSLKHLIRKHGGALPERDVREYTRMILEALSYVHGRGYVHCDIKPGNILVFPSPDGGNNLKIADFGAAKKRFSKLKKGCPVTLSYRPPESVSYNLNEAPMDIWSLGCTVIEMITGKQAWAGKKFKDVHELRREIALGEGLPGIPQNLSDEGKDFLGRCLVRDWRFRWTAEMLLHHPFVAQEHARFHSITASRAVGFASNKCSSSYDKWISEEPAVKEDYKLATNCVSSQAKAPDQPAAIEEYYPLAYDNQSDCPCYKCTNYVLSEPKASDQSAAVEGYHPLAYDNRLGCPCYKCKFIY
ncbi:mitogen-activated protein kinase kinase kinase 20-like [Diospyros lotus]|uniref:mitogen-activated protein kinase kinase kinase 20-like n=1 Tax=Diospyros lotus TaxID=55363 RepID=UPI00224D89A8|nr:mitogen-activated protein kinase kinase kinase 20-like [Diospyros lotus]